MLLRGFTTLRDVGGADHGITTAVESGIVRSPRLAAIMKDGRLVRNRLPN
jgi:hypothetical protein